MKKKALITGITGQDGSYLAELLLGKGYEVHGIIRRASSFNTGRLDHLYRDPHEEGTHLFLHYGDMGDSSGLRQVLSSVDPDEVYNLACQSHVRVSFDKPVYTAEIAAIGTLKLLEALRDHERDGNPVRMYQAGSSEMFGGAAAPQSEDTPFEPRSPYAVAKVAAHEFCRNYREAYGMFVTNGILFNHESPRRGETFVTRKITRAVGRIKAKLQDKLYLGNLSAKRDWGFAGDYVEAMWLMLQQPQPDDFVVATGESHTVQEFVDEAFQYANLDSETHIDIDPRYFRPTEVDELCGSPEKAMRKLGWRPRTTFFELVRMMVDADMDLAQRERTLVDAGHPISTSTISLH